MPNRIAEHTRILDADTEILVRMEFDARRLVEYAVVLIHNGRAIRSFDNVHGQHDVHRYDEQGRKLEAEKFSDGTVQDGLEAALTYLQQSWQRIIDS